jgi:aqualysin 1
MKSISSISTSARGILFQTALAFGLLALPGCGSDSGADLYIDDEGDIGEATQFIRAADPVSGQYIVVLKDADDAESVDAKSSKLGARYGLRSGQVFKRALRGFVVNGNEAQARALAKDPEVAYVAEDSWIHADTTQSSPTWGLDRIDDRSLPVDSSYTYVPRGGGVHAYVIDTGIRSTHNEFGGRVSLDYTAFSDSYGASDCHGHGTHVAGTIGGSTYGVAKEVSLHAVRVLDCSGSGTTSGVIGGIDWVTDNHVSPAVINMSLGGSASTALDTAVQEAINAGITVVVAAGNDGASACNYSPARASNAITVGATNSSDAKTSWSNYGSCVDIFAPGDGITSATEDSDSSTASWSGTSMASPHVAGVAAIHLELNPDATPSEVATALFAAASTGKVTGGGTGSPDRLLYSPFARVSSLRTTTTGIHYASAVNGGGGTMRADRTAVGTWETFNLVDLNGGALEDGDLVNLQAYSGYFVVAEGSGGGDLRANRTAAGAWETFTIIRTSGSGTISSGDTIALQAPSGRTAIGPWEKFVLTY